MDPMLESFIRESRDNLETAGHCFLELEKKPGDKELLNELFRSMHTIKGSSGLFDIPALTKVVHAAEDVLDCVREGGLQLTADHVDFFLDSMDCVSAWLDELEHDASLPVDASVIGLEFEKKLRCLLDQSDANNVAEDEVSVDDSDSAICSDEVEEENFASLVALIPDEVRRNLYQLGVRDGLHLLAYEPEEMCFFNGDDPLHTVSQIPGLQWFTIEERENWPAAEELDPFKCNLRFTVLLSASEEEMNHHFRYVMEQVQIRTFPLKYLIFPTGESCSGESYKQFVTDAKSLLHDQNEKDLSRRIDYLLDLSSDEILQASALKWVRCLVDSGDWNNSLLPALIASLVSGTFTPDQELSEENILSSVSEDEGQSLVEQIDPKVQNLLDAQITILNLPCPEALLDGRINSTSRVLQTLFTQLGWQSALSALEKTTEACITERSAKALLDLLEQVLINPQISEAESIHEDNTEDASDESIPVSSLAVEEPTQVEEKVTDTPSARTDNENTRSASSKTLRVEQSRIDALMDLVGELIVAKNALPFLAKRAEEEFGVRDLAKEIKSQYAIINRLSDEMQSAMMSVRMVPVSSVFQRFPRLVRDLSRKLEKKINLVMDGEDTEADKNVIENLSDPLIHLVRNSLDHGIESPEERKANGKPEEGTLTLRAIPHDDQVVIEIVDDGKGIDPNIIKRKAYEKGVIDEAKLESISDQEAVELIFAAGLSSRDVTSDLSGRGVGMDVVRSAVQQSGGQVVVESKLGVGTTMRLYLPLSMAITRVMMVDVDNQAYGISMECIRETLRVPAGRIQKIKRNETIVNREKLVPVKRMRDLLGLPSSEVSAEEEALLIVKLGGEEVALVIDEFHEGIDIIQKPLDGVMRGFPIYSGATLLGDGRVLLILNLQELI